MKNEGLKPLFSKAVSLLGRFERYQISTYPAPKTLRQTLWLTKLWMAEAETPV
ncbi:hypothetical protein C1G86_0318 [Dehalococcoides mccartyi]|uniref:Uncharacterized protein n=1 Tax=Dehalococcoides mccartyi TaxID=61435 RepID=A0A328ETI7_9CHLR|nr:hypothetical protein C1G86_0318 [Dehalococcoides mccartyi]